MDGSIPIAAAAVASQEDREAVVPETSGDGFVSEELVMENVGEGGGALQEEEEEEEENGDLSNQQLVTEAELEALLSAAPSLPEESRGVKIPNGKREESTAAAASGGTVSKRVSAASSSLLKKRSNVSSSSGSTTPRTLPPPSPTFLRSSSAKAAARRLLEASGDAPNLVSEKGANAIGKHSSSSSTSDSAPSTPVMRRSLSGSSTRTSAIPIPSSTPTTTQSRRASFSSVSTSAAAAASENHRRASLSARPSLNRSVDMTAAELRKWEAPKLPLKTSGRPPNSVSSPKTPPNSLKRSGSSAATPSKNSLSSEPGKLGTKAASPSAISQNASKPVLPPPSPRVDSQNVVAGEPNRAAIHSTPARKKLSPSVLLPKRSTSSSVENSSLNGSLSKSTSRLVTLPPPPPVVESVKPAAAVGGDADVRLDLRGHKVRNFDAATTLFTSKLEFLYLRDNKLSDLKGIQLLKRLKVLDISFNEFTGAGSLEQLQHCPMLQQLYLAGNQITSLTSLPQLPNLEFLSIAQNKIKSLAMAGGAGGSQPRLQVLAASKNKITTFKGFPYLPSLQHLRLEENPILLQQQSLHLQAQAIMLVGRALIKFNDRDLSVHEKELAGRYPPHTAWCLQRGWKLCAPEQAVASTMEFLVSHWTKLLPPGFAVKKVHMDLPAEEDPCHCEFMFEKLKHALEQEDKEEDTKEEEECKEEDSDSELELHYQWFVAGETPIDFLPVEGAVSDTFWPKHEEVGHSLKVECTIVLKKIKFGPVFAISKPVSPGTGCPKVLRLEVEGEAIEGSLIKGSAVVAWCGGTPGGKSLVSWLRQESTKDSNSVAIVSGAEDSAAAYKLTLDDVGLSLMFMFTPVTEEGVKGEAQFAVTPVIQAAQPCVTAVKIVGEAIEGNLIRGIGNYFGGREGVSKFQWLRESLESGEFKLVLQEKMEYTLTDKDVGLRMMFKYTPVRTDGCQGDPVTAMTAKVLLAPPRVEKLRLLGDMKEGGKVAISAIFTGGTEGASCVQWFKKSTPGIPAEDEQLEPLSSSTVAKAFCIPLAVVGHYLVAKYTPVRSTDGESGKPTFIISESVVEMLPPELTFLNIVGECTEGETLTAQYRYAGGYEGGSQYEWCLHESKSGYGTSIPEAAGQLQYRITKQAVNRFLSFRCKPVRDDGLQGDWQSTFTADRIQAGSPMFLSLRIVGEPTEGHQIHLEKEYWGGDEGSSKVQWFLTRQDWTQREIKGATEQSYTISVDDIEGLICVSCQPVRSDGVTGPVSVSAPIGPVLPAPPMCKALQICGLPVEGGSLSFEASYTGGEKGDCTHKWVRVNSNGIEELLSTDDDKLDLTSEDVGSRIKLVFTPIRKDGAAGDSQLVLSEEVVDGEPEGQGLVIPQCFQDVEVVPQTVYFGGQEGASEFTWYRTKHKLEDGRLPSDAHLLCKTEVCTPRLDEVGSHLLLHWVPVRKDGKRGTPIIAYSDLVLPAFPEVCNVAIREVSEGVFVGEGVYYGGLEGRSHVCWYRQTAGNVRTLIPGAETKMYVVSDEDYTCSLIFGYTPVRSDGVSGNLMISEHTAPIYPELPRIQKLVISGKVMEGETITAVEVIPNTASQQHSWEQYTKEIRYQWSRLWQPESPDTYERLALQQACMYKVRLEDVGYCLRCECIVLDLFGRSTEPVIVITSPVVPSFPRVDCLEIEGRGYHTSLYAVRGIYSGGREGKSLVQWFRAMAGSPDLIPISGEVGRMYEANVDDVAYNLVAMYTPVREDGVEGGPVTAATEPIIVDPEVAKEVKLKVEAGAVKFEALRDSDRLTPVKAHRNQGLGNLERRVVDVNRKRVKVIKPGSRTSFASTEHRGTYAPPFHVEVFRGDQQQIKIVMDMKHEVDIMVQSRHIRDIFVLVIRSFSQQFNSTPLNLLLKM
ncbi:unnamed protein product [Sphagnum jensenii]|uniref:Uncharacterized protein n=1 Tax=Sphagnum jensenii TaxID=128206 RepID=A0ABP1B9Y3_9BRYO